MGRPGKIRIVLAVTAICLIWGTTWSVIQIGLRSTPPFTGIALRFAIAAVVLFLVARSMGVHFGRTPIERKIWLVNGLLSFSISYGIVYWAEQWVPSGLTAVLFATYPLFVALLAHFALAGERLNLGEVIGIVLGFGGVGVIYSEDFAVLGGEDVFFASMVMLGSPLAASVGTIVIKRWGKGIHPASITGGSMAMTAALMGLVAVASERHRTFIWDLNALWALLYLALAGSAVTFVLYYWLLSHVPAKRAALVTYVIPLVAVGVGALRGEPLLSRTLLGAGLVIGGVALAVHTTPAPVQEREP